MVSACLIKLGHNRENQGCHRRCTLKSIVSILLLVTVSQTFASEYGSLNGADLISLDEERVHNLVASSAEIRGNISVGRNVAGQTEEEQKWASEYDSLMDDNSEVDYLELASKL